MSAPSPIGSPIYPKMSDEIKIAPVTTPLDITSEKKETSQALHLEDLPTDAIRTAKWEDLRADAMVAEEAERSLGIKESLRLYPKAVAWSLGISLCIVMEGYDLGSESLRYRLNRADGSAGQFDWSTKVQGALWLLHRRGEWISAHASLADCYWTSFDNRMLLVSSI